MTYRLLALAGPILAIWLMTWPAIRPAAGPSAASQGVAWSRLTPLGLPATRLGLGADGSVWARFSRAARPSEKDVILRWQGSPPMVTFRGTVKSGAAEAAKLGAGTASWPKTLTGFWSTDADGRVWIGAKVFFRGRWTDVGSLLSGASTSLEWSDEVALDGEGRAWVPFARVRSCTPPDVCTEDGLRAFAATGPLDLGLALETVPEADAAGLPPAWILAGELGAKGELLGPFVAGRRDLFTLPLTTPARLPPFDPTVTTTIASGYVTAASRASGDKPRLLVWTEERIRDVGLVHHHRLYTWLGERWSMADTLDDSPLTLGTDSADSMRLTALARSADGETLWIAGSMTGTGGNTDPASGGVARFAARQWDAAFIWQETGLQPRTSDPLPLARAMIVDSAGRVWLATSAGLAVYAADRPEAADPGLGALFVPAARRR